MQCICTMLVQKLWLCCEFILWVLVGHCTNEDLIEQFEHFGEDRKWSPSHLLQLGMDGPKVNLAFQRKLLKSLEEKS